MTVEDVAHPSSRTAREHGPYFIPSVHLPPLKHRPRGPVLAQALSHLALALRLDGHENVHVPKLQRASANRADALDKSDLTDPIQAQAQDSLVQFEAAAEDHETSQAENLFELRYSRIWLSALVKTGLSWVDDEPTRAENADEDVTVLLDRATELLSACAGKSASGPVFRIYHFDSPVGSLAVKVRDGTLTADALGSRTWGSASMLAQHLMSPFCKLINERKPHGKTSLIQILELGAGTGLVGLAIAALVQRMKHNVRANVCLTDFHPDVLENLAFNVRQNFASDPAGSTGPSVQPQVSVAHLDWSQVSKEAARDQSQNLTDDHRQALSAHPQHDMILAADCCYERHHALWLRATVERYLSREYVLGNDHCNGEYPLGALHLLNAIRATHSHESRAIEEAFPAVAESMRGQSDRLKRTSLQLRVVHQMDFEGYDDFGPPTLRLDVPLDRIIKFGGVKSL
ncbi:Putative N2,N2-dimethylguanosine tRNA methyltransferase [Ceraceosorus bombacis]|uniref:Putative N2,N2-dimethylguanosine tRNA methyltransferase n=1 Tax=Ceraceosorus bombacis TaxID=401625 RepID=A0A0P1BS49_9BASI|nr:Putative N2,N2-dimethylguanosine tRNA methyltransferase [Ceraceosorus bombacis]